MGQIANQKVLEMIYKIANQIKENKKNKKNNKNKSKTKGVQNSNK